MKCSLLFALITLVLEILDHNPSYQRTILSPPELAYSAIFRDAEKAVELQSPMSPPEYLFGPCKRD